MNTVDASRYTASVKQLLTHSIALGFQDDIQHWTEVLRERGEL